MWWEGAHNHSAAGSCSGSVPSRVEGGELVSLRHAQLVISTDFVRCVICVIMVQLKTAGGNNSAPFVHSETFLRYNVLFLPWQGMF